MLRRESPQRTCDREYANYNSYKDYLRNDFNRRCGYCDITDIILGGKKTFQIDHFAPKKFEELVTNYSNLVYSCPSCNRAKWDDWPMETSTPSHDNSQGYVDPCDDDYEAHLERDEYGRIIAKTDVGNYMRRNLKLYLLKHKYLWMQDILADQIQKIRSTLSEANGEDDDIANLRAVYNQLTDKYFLYYKINWGEE